MYEVIQKLTIPATGINVNAIAGDTSKTAFEFAQRIEANNKRSEMRLKEWESGPLKRLGTLLLSANISELTVQDLEQVREKDYGKILKDIKKGRATREDFEFEGGKPVKRKHMYYIDMKGWKEHFTAKRASRKLDPDSTDNTLVEDRESPEAVNKIPVTEEYVYPSWYVDSGVLFDTKVDSKRMITNRKIRDTRALNSVLQNLISLIQVDPKLAERVDIPKLFTQVLKLAEMDEEDIMKTEDNSEIGEIMKKIKSSKDSQKDSQDPTQPREAAPQLPIPTQPNLPPVAPQNPLSTIAQ